MVQLFGRAFTRRQLQAYAGNLSQVGGIRPIELAGGRERGVRGFDITTGSGLAFTVLADRALDITSASFRGRSLCLHAPGGQAHPTYYEPAGLGWLRTFSGGLLATCGLSNVGGPNTDEGEELGLHGRIGTLPAEELGFWGEWVGDEYWMHVTGTVTEGVIFGNPLRLTRRIKAQLGGNSIHLEDTVENLGAQPAPLMILYHCNFGFPLLSPGAELVLDSREAVPRDAASAPELGNYMRFQEPTPDYGETVFYHDLAADNDGDVRLALVNRALDGGLGISMRYHKKTLPRFTQWKMMKSGTYVLGLEPGNCQVGGRAAERARGTLQVLQPGEARAFRLEIGILDGIAAIEDYLATIR
ncbi:MAG: aldose 1-epimerase family protein [Armatimonadota bacterium]